MNGKLNSGFYKRLQHRLAFHVRLFDANTQANSFTSATTSDIDAAIQRIYVINLERKPDRWNQVHQELSRIRGHLGIPLSEISRRFPAVDARYLCKDIDSSTLRPSFTLADQLLVEPNSRVDSKMKARRINMTSQEIAVALSHIELWKLVASSSIPYTLILEDDVYFRYGFAQNFDAAWLDVTSNSKNEAAFDILFLSFQEVGTRPITRKKPATVVRRPERGIWQASGYVLSQVGAQKLIDMLPAYGPIDLWLNLQFGKLDVYLTKRSIIEQRADIPSTNSYSIMPVLAQIGVHTRDKPLVVPPRKLPEPVFAYGLNGSGLTSLAVALSIIGYTCCSDIKELPAQELDNLLKGRRRRHLDAYVNIGSINSLSIRDIGNLYPNARFIFTTRDDAQIAELGYKRALYLPNHHSDKWRALCGFLNCEYPASPFPSCSDIGQQDIANINNQGDSHLPYKFLRSDSSPWIISSRGWKGISIAKSSRQYPVNGRPVMTWDGRNSPSDSHWRFRDDTFPGNLSIFTPENVKVNDSGLTQLTFREETTTVRSYTSAAITTQHRFLYGKFIAVLKPSNVPGLVTGVFLHRNSPHQEIDIEFVGKDTTKMLVNVFYNPGTEGTKLEYGYRGTPVLVDLGFDAADEFHSYEIEWDEHSLRWYVDGRIVHDRVLWNPTPIPNLPMEFNVNLWYSRSRELAGRLDKSQIPARAEIKWIHVISNML